MFVHPRPGWRVSCSDPPDLLFALYVRDAAGIVAADDVPRLTPTVPPAPLDRSPEQQRALVHQWSRWWSDLLGARPADGSNTSRVDGPEFRSTVGAPELRVVQRELFDPALAWRREHRWEMNHDSALVATTLVRDIEQHRRRPARPFAYGIDVVPVRGPLVRDLSPTRLLLSEELWDDPSGLREVLLLRLAALA